MRRCRAPPIAWPMPCIRATSSCSASERPPGSRSAIPARSPACFSKPLAYFQKPAEGTASPLMYFSACSCIVWPNLPSVSRVSPTMVPNFSSASTALSRGCLRCFASSSRTSSDLPVAPHACLICEGVTGPPPAALTIPSAAPLGRPASHRPRRNCICSCCVVAGDCKACNVACRAVASLCWVSACLCWAAVCRGACVVMDMTSCHDKSFAVGMAPRCLPTPRPPCSMRYCARVAPMPVPNCCSRSAI